MKARRVHIHNLIPFLSGRADGIKQMEGSPKEVLTSVRGSCEYRVRIPAKPRAVSV